jgi:hypothetical protein
MQSLANELALLTSQKVAVQRDFEAYKEVATQVRVCAIEHGCAASSLQPA